MQFFPEVPHSRPMGVLGFSYTSIGHPSPEQWIAVPKDDDLLYWDRPAVNPVLTLQAHGQISVWQWRNPFLI